MRLNICVLPGDGIGPEVTREAVRVLRYVAETQGYDFRFTERAIGASAIHQFDSPLPQTTIDTCKKSDAVLLGAVGSPEFDSFPPSKRPEAGLLGLRKALGGFANLRPAIAYAPIANCSPLKPEILGNANILFVRELLGGLYFGEPRGFEGNRDSAFNTMRYSVEEIERVARVAFELARKRKKKVTSVDKANVLETSQLWREVVSCLAKEYADVKLEHMLVDSCAMRIITDPTSFDVVVTENLFGDILSDEAAVITGSLGMLSSATIGGDIDLYEPVHGSAPDIAGKNIANPLGAIASVAMLFRYTAKNESAAFSIENAIESVLSLGYRTADIAHQGCRYVSTDEMTTIVAQHAVENVGSTRAYHAV